jgi:hypothetical protein
MRSRHLRVRRRPAVATRRPKRKRCAGRRPRRAARVGRTKPREPRRERPKGRSPAVKRLGGFARSSEAPPVGLEPTTCGLEAAAWEADSALLRAGTYRLERLDRVRFVRCGTGSGHHTHWHILAGLTKAARAASRRPARHPVAPDLLTIVLRRPSASSVILSRGSEPRRRATGDPRGGAAPGARRGAARGDLRARHRRARRAPLRGPRGVDRRGACRAGVSCGFPGERRAQLSGPRRPRESPANRGEAL